MAFGGVAGCSMLGLSSATPSTQAPSPVISASPVTPTLAVSPTEPSDTATTTPTVSTTPSVKPVGATGILYLQGGNLASESMSGTCAMVDGLPTLAVSDKNNEFFGAITMTVVLTTARNAVDSVKGELASDSEEVNWQLSYDADAPVAGTSMKVTGSGAAYIVSGTLATVETHRGKRTAGKLPVKLQVKCATSAW